MVGGTGKWQEFNWQVPLFKYKSSCDTLELTTHSYNSRQTSGDWEKCIHGWFVPVGIGLAT